MPSQIKSESRHVLTFSFCHHYRRRHCVGAVLNFVVGTVATTLQYFAFVIDWPLLPHTELSTGDRGSVCNRSLKSLAKEKFSPGYFFIAFFFV
jgi:hypothetical protein